MAWFCIAVEASRYLRRKVHEGAREGGGKVHEGAREGGGKEAAEVEGRGVRFVRVRKWLTLT